MIEYPAMIYKSNRNRTYVASCMVKNLVGFGKTEEEAIKNLKECIHNVADCLVEAADINIKPCYGLQIAK